MGSDVGVSCSWWLYLSLFLSSVPHPYPPQSFLWNRNIFAKIFLVALFSLSVRSCQGTVSLSVWNREFACFLPRWLHLPSCRLVNTCNLSSNFWSVQLQFAMSSLRPTFIILVTKLYLYILMLFEHFSWLAVKLSEYHMFLIIGGVTERDALEKSVW